MEDKFGVWDIARKCFEDNARLDYESAMNLALFCSYNDEIGYRNFAVIEMDDNGNPIFHKMVWCGGFHGLDYLSEYCSDKVIILMEDDVNNYEGLLDV